MMGNEKLKLKNKLVTDRNFSVAKLISPHYEIYSPVVLI